MLSRRHFIGGIASIIAAQKSPAYITKSLLGAINTDFIEDVPSDKPMASDYIQENLVAMWDGIENVGWGTHSASSTSWIDLIGGSIIDVSNCSFSKDELFMPRNLQITGNCDALSDLCTVEFVMSCTCTKQSIIRFDSDIIRIRQNDWNSQKTRIRFDTKYSSTVRRSYSSSTYINIAQRNSFSLCDSNSYFFNSTPISGSYIAASQIQNTGNFVFDSTSDSSNTGLAISNLRIYNRSLSYEEMEFNFLIDQERFSLT